MQNYDWSEAYRLWDEECERRIRAGCKVDTDGSSVERDLVSSFSKKPTQICLKLYQVATTFLGCSTYPDGEVTYLVKNQLKGGRLIVNEVAGVNIFYNALYNGYDSARFATKYGQDADNEVRKYLNIPFRR
jgi:hypothetical protein